LYLFDDAFSTQKFIWIRKIGSRLFVKAEENIKKLSLTLTGIWTEVTGPRYEARVLSM
jgi:hypothetical protein